VVPSVQVGTIALVSTAFCPLITNEVG